MAFNIIRFDFEDRQDPAPDFHLYSSSRKRVSFGDLHSHGGLILMFLHPPYEIMCQHFLSAVQIRLADYQHLDARLAVIFPCPGEDLPTSTYEPVLTYLADPHNTIRQTYANLMAPELVQESDTMLFVLDSYGGIYTCLIGNEPDNSTQDELLNWLDFIGIQCPE